MIRGNTCDKQVYLEKRTEPIHNLADIIMAHLAPWSSLQHATCLHPSDPKSILPLPIHLCWYCFLLAKRRLKIQSVFWLQSWCITPAMSIRFYGGLDCITGRFVLILNCILVLCFKFPTSLCFSKPRKATLHVCSVSLPTSIHITYSCIHVCFYLLNSFGCWPSDSKYCVIQLFMTPTSNKAVLCHKCNVYVIMAEFIITTSELTLSQSHSVRTHYLWQSGQSCVTSPKDPTTWSATCTRQKSSRHKCNIV